MKMDDYIKIYPDFSQCIKILSPNELRVLVTMVCRMSSADDAFYGMCVLVSGKAGEELCKDLGYANRSSLSPVLTKLVKHKAIFRRGAGMYQINPHLFGKGKWEEIARLRQKYEPIDFAKHK